ncbi:MAG TPA: zinc ribbon domain-containing protein [Anaerolineaceae bacterium]|nr:zinc ribbon domain-containing protein [Anaerolineaceae bacterium]
MNNYYDLLNISQDANQSEIETVLDDQYTKWRALVTHHDNNVVAQANQALSQLEEIRNTLMNPEKRRVYNNSLLASQGNVAGLADPDILLAQNPVGHVMAPPRPRVGGGGQAAQAEMDRTDAWICTNPNCKKANPIGTQFCVKCGTRIGLDCPSCGEFVEISNKFCSSCGVNKAEYFKKNQAEQLQSLQEQIKDYQAEIQNAETNPKQYFRAKAYAIKGNAKVKTPLGNIASVALILGIALASSGSCGGESGLTAIGILLIVVSAVGIFYASNKATQEYVSRYVADVLRPQVQKLKDDITIVQHEKYE